MQNSNLIKNNDINETLNLSQNKIENLKKLGNIQLKF